eukprot:9487269-Ditylum_brightwellii.AAC.1
MVQDATGGNNSSIPDSDAPLENDDNKMNDAFQLNDHEGGSLRETLTEMAMVLDVLMLGQMVLRKFNRNEITNSLQNLE